MLRSVFPGCRIILSALVKFRVEFRVFHGRYRIFGGIVGWAWWGDGIDQRVWEGSWLTVDRWRVAVGSITGWGVVAQTSVLTWHRVDRRLTC